MTVGCEVGDLPGGSESDDPGTDDVTCDSFPLGEPRDPATLPACCEAEGEAHCLDDGTVPDLFKDLVEACPGSGGLCVPDKFIESGGTYIPLQCQAAIGGEGVCLSRCVPQVRENQALLGQDICDADELCVPCTDPRTGEPTGACALLENTCDALPTDDPPPGGDLACPHTGEPLIDPATFPSCNSCGDATCVPNDLVPAEFVDRLGPCDSDPGAKCVPNEFVETLGNIIPDSCASVAGFEGRCLSRCLPEVSAQAELLPQDTCAATHACVPCFDPLSGADTGACKLSCDPGPSVAAQQLPSCADNRGTCVPAELAGAQAESLGEVDCPEDTGLLCAPNEFLPPNTPSAVACTTGGLIGGGQDGACLPDFLGAVDSFLISQGSCSDGYKCAPCETPIIGGSTGACDLIP
jgi:hypothetical protein